MLNFYDGDSVLQITQIISGANVDGIRIFLSERDGVDDNTIMFDLQEDDIKILIRHFNAYIENGNLMRV